MPAWFVSADRSSLKQNKRVRVSHSTSQKASFSDNKAKQENAVGAREALSCLFKMGQAGFEEFQRGDGNICQKHTGIPLQETKATQRAKRSSKNCMACKLQAA